MIGAPLSALSEEIGSRRPMAPEVNSLILEQARSWVRYFAKKGTRMACGGRREIQSRGQPKSWSVVTGRGSLPVSLISIVRSAWTSSSLRSRRQASN
jgi:hypothetical protein